MIGTSSKKAVSTTEEIKEVTVVGKPAKTITTNADQCQEVVVTGDQQESLSKPITYQILTSKK